MSLREQNLLAAAIVTLNVKNFGAKGNGTTDDTAAFQAAIDAAYATGGGVVLVPPTAAGYRFTGKLTLKPFVVLRGTWGAPTSGTYRTALVTKGSELQVTYGAGGSLPANAFITLQRGAQVEGLTFYYPNQTATNPPVAYPPTIVGEALAGDTTVSNCQFVNPYIALWFDHHERPLIRHVYGEPLNIGIYLDRIVDVPRLESVHFWAAFWQEYDLDPEGTGYPLSSYLQANATAFKFGRVDDLFMSDCGAAGYYRGAWFTISGVGADYGAGGGYSYGKVNNCMFDLCTIGMQYDGGTFPIAVANTTFFCSGTSAQANLRAVKTTGGAVNHGGLTFTNCVFGGLDLPPVLVDIQDGTGDQTITLIGCYFDTWKNTAGGGAAVRLADGTTQLALIGCEFRQNGASYTHIDVSALDSADLNQKILVGNKFKGQKTISNAGLTPIIESASAVGSATWGEFGQIYINRPVNEAIVIQAPWPYTPAFRMTDGDGVNLWFRQTGGTFQIINTDFSASFFDVNQQGDTHIYGKLQHTGSTAGFFNTTPAAKPTVTGSRASGAALASLLTALAALGLITDSSSA